MRFPTAAPWMAPASAARISSVVSGPLPPGPCGVSAIAPSRKAVQPMVACLSWLRPTIILLTHLMPTPGLSSLILSRDRGAQRRQHVGLHPRQRIEHAAAALYFDIGIGHAIALGGFGDEFGIVRRV